MKRLLLILPILFLLSACGNRQFGCKTANSGSPCENEWTALYYSEGLSGMTGNVAFEAKEGFQSSEECLAWATQKKGNNEQAEFTCGRGCTYNKGGEFGCQGETIPSINGFLNEDEIESVRN